MIANMKYTLAKIIILAFLISDVGSVAPTQTENPVISEKLTTFNVTINSAPTIKHGRAIEYCVSIIETLWVSNITTVVKVDF